MIIRDQNGVWRFDGPRPHSWNSHYGEAIINYLNYLDIAFSRAYRTCEFEFLLTLFRVRGLQDAGWDPYETSIKAVKNITEIAKKTRNWETQKNLLLWLYGHIVEASEPYEMLSNLIDISMGGCYSISQFSPHKRGKPKSPGEKISELKRKAVESDMKDVVRPLEDIWNRDLRNAIFHSDYALYGGETRITSTTGGRFSNEAINILINKALAYFDSLKNLYQAYIGSYDKPKVIDVHHEFSKDPDEMAVVIIRQSYGAVGLKDNWTFEELRRGKIPFRIGRFFPEEIKLLDKQPTLSVLPERPTEKQLSLYRRILKFLFHKS